MFSKVFISESTKKKTEEEQKQQEQKAKKINEEGCEKNKNNDLEGAIRSFTQAIEIFPLPPFYYNRGFAYYKLTKKIFSADINSLKLSSENEKHLSLAISDFKKVLEKSSYGKIISESHYYLGKIYYQQNELELALGHFHRYIQLEFEKKSENNESKEIKAKKIQAYYNRAAVHHSLGNNACAISDFIQVLKIEPEQKDAKENLRIIFKELRDEIEELEPNFFDGIKKEDLFFATDHLENKDAIFFLRLCLLKENQLGVWIQKKLCDENLQNPIAEKLQKLKQENNDGIITPVCMWREYDVNAPRSNNQITYYDSLIGRKDSGL